ncbi:MarR family winged helix-turn-helix transcriptional regulator [Sphingopyxis sp. NJF-3]
MQEKLEGATSGPLDLRVWVRLLSCVMRMEKSIRRNFIEQFDTTLPRFDVMASLDRHPQGQTMGDLSRSLLVSKGNVTAIVRQLEAQELVVSTVDPADRRSAIVALTAKGRHVFDELAAAHHGWIQDLMRDFPRTSQRELFELLAELKSSIAKA